MEVFGNFEATKIAREGSLTQIMFARKAGTTEERFAVKIYRPPSYLVLDDSEIERDAALFLESAESQKAGAALAPGSWGPVHDSGRCEGGAWYATDIYLEGSLEWFRINQRDLEVDQLRRVMELVVQGLLGLKTAQGRAHGNLKPTNVLMQGRADLARARIALSDPKPSSKIKGEDDANRDARDLGDLVHQLVLHRPFQNVTDWPIEKSEKWTRLGKAGEQWRDLVNKLIDPTTVKKPSIDDIAKLIPGGEVKLPSVGRTPGAASGPASSPSPAKAAEDARKREAEQQAKAAEEARKQREAEIAQKVRAEAEKKAQDEALRKAQQEQERREREAAEQKRRDEERLRREAEAKAAEEARRADEARHAEETRALAARQEEERRARSAEQAKASEEARRLAAEAKAREDEQRKAREAEEQKAREADRLKREEEARRAEEARRQAEQAKREADQAKAAEEKRRREEEERARKAADEAKRKEDDARREREAQARREQEEARKRAAAASATPSAEPAADSRSQPSEFSAKPAPKKASNAPKIAVAAAAVLLVGGGIAAAVMLSGGDKAKTDPPKPPNGTTVAKGGDSNPPLTPPDPTPTPTPTSTPTSTPTPTQPPPSPKSDDSGKITDSTKGDLQPPSVPPTDSSPTNPTISGGDSKTADRNSDKAGATPTDSPTITPADPPKADPQPPTSTPTDNPPPPVTPTGPTQQEIAKVRGDMSAIVTALNRGVMPGESVGADPAPAERFDTVRKTPAFDAIRNDAEVARVVQEVESRLAAIDEIRRATSAGTLIEAARSATTAPTPRLAEARVAWARLADAAVRITPADLKDLGALRAGIGESAASGVGSEARAKEIADLADAVGKQIWRRAALSAADDAGLRAARDSMDAFKIAENDAPAPIRFNWLLMDFKKNVSDEQAKAAGDEKKLADAVRPLADAFAKSASAIGGDVGQQQAVRKAIEEATRLAQPARPAQPAPQPAALGGDPTKLGPGSVGWIGNFNGNDTVEFTPPQGVNFNGSLVFRRVGGAFVGTTEVPVSLVAAIIDAAKGEALGNGIAKAAPGQLRTWDEVGGLPRATRAWLALPGGARDFEQWARGVAMQPPTDDMPFGRVRASGALYLASQMGCRIPTEDEWRSAAQVEGGGNSNLRDASWAQLKDAVAAFKAGPAAGAAGAPWPDSQSFNPNNAAAGRGALPAVQNNDGFPLFAPVDANGFGNTFKHLIGNVAEWVLTDATGAEGAPLAASADALDRVAFDRFRIIGGSAMSPPGLLPTDAVAPAGNNAAPVDVGFRLAFSAGGAAPPPAPVTEPAPTIDLGAIANLAYLPMDVQ